MKTSVNEALVLSAVMACAVFFCRIFPFLFFRGNAGKRASGEGASKEAFLSFVEKTVPPIAMTVLAFNSLTDFSKIKFDFLRGAVNAIPINPRDIIAAISAAAFTALVHLWRRNPLISIFGGTALYMALMRII
jgi:branched-subunit amino acid transport protein AzlD